MVLNEHSYRYQLEAFVDKLKGREPATWVSGKESIENMRVIDMIYEKVRYVQNLSSFLIFYLN